jgi:hypothetical protein
MINPRLRRCITHPHCIIKLWQAIRSDLFLGVSDRTVTACRLIHGHTVLSRTAHSGKWLVKNLRELRGDTHASQSVLVFVVGMRAGSLML